MHVQDREPYHHTRLGSARVARRVYDRWRMRFRYSVSLLFAAPGASASLGCASRDKAPSSGPGLARDVGPCTPAATTAAPLPECSCRHDTSFSVSGAIAREPASRMEHAAHGSRSACHGPVVARLGQR